MGLLGALFVSTATILVAGGAYELGKSDIDDTVARFVKEQATSVYDSAVSAGADVADVVKDYGQTMVDFVRSNAPAAEDWKKILQKDKEGMTYKLFKSKIYRNPESNNGFLMDAALSVELINRAKKDFKGLSELGQTYDYYKDYNLYVYHVDSLQEVSEKVLFGNKQYLGEYNGLGYNVGAAKKAQYEKLFSVSDKIPYLFYFVTNQDDELKSMSLVCKYSQGTEFSNVRDYYFLKPFLPDDIMMVCAGKSVDGQMQYSGSGDGYYRYYDVMGKYYHYGGYLGREGVHVLRIPEDDLNSGNYNMHKIYIQKPNKLHAYTAALDYRLNTALEIPEPLKTYVDDKDNKRKEYPILSPGQMDEFTRRLKNDEQKELVDYLSNLGGQADYIGDPLLNGEVDPALNPRIDPNPGVGISPGIGTNPGSGTNPDSGIETDPGSNPIPGGGGSGSMPPTQVVGVDDKIYSLGGVFKNKFPFCIPWDLVSAVKVLHAEPVAPRFVIPFEIKSLGFSYEFVFDYSTPEWLNLSRTIRYFVLLSFIFLLITLTRGLIRG